jgi:H+/Cl- antiporter ClcA
MKTQQKLSNSVGSDFDLEIVRIDLPAHEPTEVVQWRIQEKDAERRYVLAKLVLAGLFVWAIFALVYGVFTGNFSALSTVGATAGPFVGLILGYYFGKTT